MRLHLISLSPSCFASNQTLETTLKILNRLFHHILITNFQDLYGKTVRNYGQYLNHNRVKDFELLLLMYDKENRIVEVEPSKDQKFDSLCAFNKFLYEQGITILHSKEQVIPMASALCSDLCRLLAVRTAKSYRGLSCQTSSDRCYCSFVPPLALAITFFIRSTMPIGT